MENETLPPLRLVGIIGGLSWESSAEYYRILNEEAARRRGGLSSARLVMASVDFSFYARAMEEGRWEEIRLALLEEALRLKRAGAEALVIATNTMHRFAADLEAATGLPLLHIADAAAGAIRSTLGVTDAAAAPVPVVGLMGTRYTMEGDFYSGRLAEKYGIRTLVPDEAERIEINRIIFEELCRGEFREASRRKLLGYAEALASRGAEGIILGCTELPLVMKDGDGSVPFWDTTALHVRSAADFMTGGDDGAEAADGGAKPGAVDEAAAGAASPAALWAAYLASLPEEERRRAEARSYTSWHFCADKENADELGALAAAGIKRATASSPRAYQRGGERLPEPGDLSVITDWEGRALCIIRTDRLEIVPFRLVGEDFARREGEGDGSLAYWKAGHERYFRREHAALGIPFDEDLPVLCEDYTVVWPPAAGPASNAAAAAAPQAADAAPPPQAAAATPAAASQSDVSTGPRSAEASGPADKGSVRGPFAYFVADIRIRDKEGYGRYLAGVGEASSRSEGEYLAVDPEPQRLEGDREHGRLVIIRFPDQDALRRWYDSPEYRAVLPLRLGAADCDTVIVTGKN